MNKRKRGRPVKVVKSVLPEDVHALKIEQNVIADPPQSFERPKEEVKEAFLSNPLGDVIMDNTNYAEVEQVVEIPVVATPREVIIFRVKSLSHAIEDLEPHSNRWCEILEEIGDLKRKLDKLK